MLYKEEPTVLVLTEAEFLLVRATKIQSVSFAWRMSLLTEYSMNIRVANNQRCDSITDPFVTMEVGS